jgi:hypothetical protein
VGIIVDGMNFQVFLVEIPNQQFKILIRNDSVFGSPENVGLEGELLDVVELVFGGCLTSIHLFIYFFSVIILSECPIPVSLNPMLYTVNRCPSRLMSS